MSLKYFHLVFIVLSTVLSFGFAAWSWQNYQAGYQTVDLVLAIAAGLIGLGLIVYGFFFLKKAKRIIM
jgi:uncharacterized membrane protein